MTRTFVSFSFCLEKIKQLSDDEIRQLAKQIIWNGLYLTQICRNCGAVLCDPYKSTDYARVVDVCKDCFTP
jgi:hypothetical protein